MTTAMRLPKPFKVTAPEGYFYTELTIQPKEGKSAVRGEGTVAPYKKVHVVN